jgi:hypothetical protein
MTDHYKLGPGTLTLGSTPTDFAMQLTNCRVEPTENVTEGDDLNLLDGSTLLGEDDVTYSYVLAGTAVQDLAASGFTDYTWDNKGVTVDFVFTPVTARAATVTGECRIVPLQIGGDVKVRNTADFSFAVIGEPVFAPDTTP